jgi:hypothetical protein
MPASNASEDLDSTMLDDDNSSTVSVENISTQPSQSQALNDTPPQHNFAPGSSLTAQPAVVDRAIVTQKGLNANGKRTLAAVAEAKIGEVIPQVDEAEPDIPGASWTTSKAQTEIIKAMDTVIDKDLMIKSTLMWLRVLTQLTQL